MTTFFARLPSSPILCALVAFVSSCATTPPASAPQPAVSQAAWDACLGPAGRQRGWSSQGPDLVGTHVTGSDGRAAAVRTFLLDGMSTRDGLPIRRVRVVHGALVGEIAAATGPTEIAGAAWDKARVRAVLDCVDGTSLPLTAQIEAVHRDAERPDADAWLYHLAILDTPSGRQSACDPDLESRETGATAVEGEAKETGAAVFAGVWAASGELRERPGAFTFACAEAAVTKCDRWGYRPESAGDLHAACTRMARADYCGDGGAATRKGTQVDHWDRDGHAKRGAPRQDQTFEAAWSPRGAVCMGHPRWQGLAHTCAPSGAAGEKNEFNVPVCHTLAEAEALAGPGRALLFNESRAHR